MDSSFLVTAKDRRTVRRVTRMGCEVVRERDFKRVAYRVLDLSPEGMQVVADSRVLTGEGVIVSFKVPSSSMFVDTEAIVTRVIHGRRPGDRGLSLGLKFAPLTREVRSELALSLRRFAPLMPSRAPRIDYAATVKNISFPALRRRSSEF